MFLILILYPLLGFLIGCFIPEYSGFLQYFDVIFLRLLNVFAPYLIFAMVVKSIWYIRSNIVQDQYIKYVMLYYVFGTFLSIGIGFFSAYYIGIGCGVDVLSIVGDQKFQFESSENILLNLVPGNIMHILYHQDLMLLFILACLFGFAVYNSRSEQVVLKFCNDLYNFILEVMEYITLLIPYAFLSLVLKFVINGIGEFEVIFSLLILFAVLYIVRYIILLLEIYFIGGVSPLPFILGSFKYQSVAFLTTSSKATLPIIVQEVGELGVSKEGQQYAMSIGGILNSIGFGLDLTVMIMFILNAYGISLDIYTCCIVVILSFLSCVLGNGIPAAPLIVLSIVFEIFHVPMDVMVYIIGIDRIIDMCSTVFNVTGIAGYTLIIDGCKNRLNKTKYYQ
ncbi:MAG: cation:dicarboxylase symporter family transporter [Pseudomonadota bacterium]